MHTAVAVYTVVLQVPYHGAFYWSFHEEDCLVSHHHVILLFLFPHLLLLVSLSGLFLVSGSLTLSWCVCGGLCHGDCCVLNVPLHLNVSCLCHVFYTTQNKHTIACLVSYCNLFSPRRWASWTTSLSFFFRKKFPVSSSLFVPPSRARRTLVSFSCMPVSIMTRPIVAVPGAVRHFVFNNWFIIWRALWYHVMCCYDDIITWYLVILILRNIRHIKWLTREQFGIPSAGGVASEQKRVQPLSECLCEAPETESVLVQTDCRHSNEPKARNRSVKRPPTLPQLADCSYSSVLEKDVYIHC